MRYHASVVAAFLLLLLCIPPRPAIVQTANLEVTPAQLALLPPFCAFTQDAFRTAGGNYPVQVEIEKLKDTDPRYGKLYHYFSLFGQDFRAMHHYCRGLRDLNEVRFCQDQTCMDKLRLSAISEFDYMLANTRKDFTLRPRIYIDKAQALILLSKSNEAITVLFQSIKEQPKELTTYLFLSDFLVWIGKQELAKTVLKTGLSNLPGDQTLQDRLRNIK